MREIYRPNTNVWSHYAQDAAVFPFLAQGRGALHRSYSISAEQTPSPPRIDRNAVVSPGEILNSTSIYINWRLFPIYYHPDATTS